METKQTLLIDQLQLEVLADMIIRRLEKRLLANEERWISIEDVMKILHIKSKTTIIDMTSRGLLRYTRINAKTLLYDRDSVNEYIEKNVKGRF
ncbi:MAG: helix-turn-helix domain-containing protein [Bacteroidetes bacterium]|nr:helix-turn-helix domain-containing protein [Bacteroidota bacterium]